MKRIIGRPARRYAGLFCVLPGHSDRSLRAVDVGEYGLAHHEYFRWVDRLKLGIKG